MHQHPERHGGAEGGRDDRRQRAHRVPAQDQLVAVEGAGERRVEGRGDGGTCAGGDENTLILAPQAEVLTDLGQHRGADLAVARFHADRHAGAVRPDGGHRQPEAVLHRHTPAMQRVRLDRVDHVVGAIAAHDQCPDAEYQSAQSRHDQDTVGIDADTGAERVVAGDIEGHMMQPVDQPMQARHHGADQGAERGAGQDLGRLAGTQAALQQQQTPRPPERGGALGEVR